jgi:hypothetical protein
MTKNGFRLVRATAVAFAFFVGFTVDVSPAVWQSAPVLGNRTSTINILRRGQTEIGPRRLGREGGDLQ